MARYINQPFEFTVEGSGRFPFDMLRYDACWPLDESKDSYGLTHDDASGLRKIVLQSQRESTPTHGRWRSFGWRVVGVGNHRDEQL